MNSLWDRYCVRANNNKKQKYVITEKMRTAELEENMRREARKQRVVL